MQFSYEPLFLLKVLLTLLAAGFGWAIGVKLAGKIF